MNIKYINNTIDLSRLSSRNRKEIKQLWKKVREDYTDWVAEVRLKKINNNQSIVELFQWRSMSTWWLNRVTQKNSFTSNQWLNRIILMYFAKQYDEKLNIFTDDIILARSIKRNGFKTKIHKNNQTAYFKLFLNYTNNLLRLFASILREIEKIILFKSVDNLSIILPEDSKKIIWFRSLYPAAWVKIENKKLHDRLYESSPF